MEGLARLVSESLARHGFETPLDHRRLQWSKWFRCESSFSLLLVPGQPGIFALGEEVVAPGELPSAGGKRMLALFQIAEADDLAVALGNTEDGDVARFLKLFTILPLEEIARLSALKGQEINEAKKVLATEATALVHGRAAADEAAGTARKTFEEGTFAEALPTVEIARAELERGLGALTAFADKTKLVASNGEARRQIKAGGLKVNDATVTDEKLMLSLKDLTPEGVIKLSLGKKKHVLLKPV